MLNLVHRALARSFVRSPAKKSCTVSKPAAGEMIVSNFHDNFWRDRFPFAAPLRAPTTRSSGCVPGETGWFSQSLKFICQSAPFRCFEAGDKSDVMQQTVIAVKSEQKRTDYWCAGRVTKATYNTIG